MARPLRIEYPGAFYHVINRGHRQDPIVGDVRDRQRFLWYLERMAKQYAVVVHGYCLMPNHYHLILETPEGNLSRAVQWLNVSYAVYYNRRHEYIGHVFQGRFKAILVDADTYLEVLSRYIHINPVRAGLCSHAKDYPWSSCRYFVKTQTPPDWLETHRILSGFGRTLETARKRYSEYLRQSDLTDPFDDVVGRVLLGSTEFVEWAKDCFLSNRQEHEIPQLKSLRPRPSLEQITEEVRRYYKVSMNEILQQGGKRNRARDVAIYLAREMSGFSCQRLGQYFGGVSGAAVTMRYKFMANALKNRKQAKTVDCLRKRIDNA